MFTGPDYRTGDRYKKILYKLFFVTHSANRSTCHDDWIFPALYKSNKKENYSHQSVYICYNVQLRSQTHDLTHSENGHWAIKVVVGERSKIWSFTSQCRFTWCQSTSGVRTIWFAVSTWRTCKLGRLELWPSSTSWPGPTLACPAPSRLCWTSGGDLTLLLWLLLS